MHDEDLLRTSSRIYAATTTLGTTAAQITSASEDLLELILQADPNNIVNVLIGSASVQAWVLEPGDTFNCPIRNPGLLWAKASSGTAVVNLIGRTGA